MNWALFSGVSDWLNLSAEAKRLQLLSQNSGFLTSDGLVAKHERRLFSWGNPEKSVGAGAVSYTHLTLPTKA